jgi:hypothetical protein
MGRGRDGGVERGVETGYGGHALQDAAYHFEPHQRLRLVQRGQVAEQLEAMGDSRVDQYRGGELRPAMDDAVANRVDGAVLNDEALECVFVDPTGWGLELFGRDQFVGLVEDRELETARAGVDN